MQIEFERHGGFAGVRLGSKINVDELPADEADRIKHLIEAADFFNLPAQIAAPKRQPDRFTYKISISGADRQHVVTADETAAPPSLVALIQALTSVSKQRRRA